MTTKARIERLLAKGIRPGEVAKKLNIAVSYVYGVRARAKKEADPQIPKPVSAKEFMSELETLDQTPAVVAKPDPAAQLVEIMMTVHRNEGLTRYTKSVISRALAHEIASLPPNGEA